MIVVCGNVVRRIMVFEILWKPFEEAFILVVGNCNTVSVLFIILVTIADALSLVLLWLILHLYGHFFHFV